LVPITEKSSSKKTRRALFGSIGLGVAGVGAGLIYRAAPFFWQQWAKDLGKPVEPAHQHPNPKQWPDRGLYAAWLGHSTMLLKLDGFTILTDPVFSTWIGPGFGPFTLGMKRVSEPALAIDALPRLDLILLSHAHFDHFDLPSLRALERKDVEVITARNTSDLLRVPAYAKVRELGWGESAQAGPARIQGLEVNHWGARMRTDTWRGYNGYFIEAGRWRVLIAGDTADTDAFQVIGGVHAAIMPVGAYNPWIRAHCNPEQAWRMANEARADVVIPVHHKTFSLSSEPPDEPIERLLNAAGAAADQRVPLRSLGATVSLA
jgi:L-ascorbate metabolism protein UlaG (beta-lactamase superfamily)